MHTDTQYITSIPEHAREEIIGGKPGGRRRGMVKNYYLGKSLVGTREYSWDGTLEFERSFKDGVRHGCV